MKESAVIALQYLKAHSSLFGIDYELFDKYNADGNIYPPMCTETVISLLEFIFNDKDRWIYYWTFELDFGKDYEDGWVTQKDGTIIPLKTAEDLYDLLVKNMEESKEE